MRLLSTPDSWRPTGPVKRYRSFHLFGYPTWRIVFGLLALGASAFAWWSIVQQAMVRTVPVPLADLGVAAAVTIFALLLLVSAARRLLVGHDGALELDPATRRMLVLSRDGEPRILAFGEIARLTVHVTDQPYTSGRLVRTVDIIAAPSGTVLLTKQAETVFTRDAAVAQMRSLARKMSSVLGVPAAAGAAAPGVQGAPALGAPMLPNWAASAAEHFLKAESELRAMHGIESLFVRPQLWSTGGYRLAAAGWAFLDGNPAILPHHLDLLVIETGGHTMGRRPTSVLALLQPYTTRHRQPVPHLAVRVPEADKPRLLDELSRLPEHAPQQPSPPRPMHDPSV